MNKSSESINENSEVEGIMRRRVATKELEHEARARSRSIVRRSPRDIKEKPWINDDLNVLQLDIVDRVVLKTADKRDLAHKDKLTEWINSHLEKVNVSVTDMFQDFRSGQNLITLIEVLTHEKLNREKGKFRFHALQNVKTALECLQKHNIKYTNIRPDDIVDGNPKLTLALIWTIVFYYQEIDGEISARDFIVWCRDKITSLQEVKSNLSLSKSKVMFDELKYLRNVEMPQKQREKQKLIHNLNLATENDLQSFIGQQQQQQQQHDSLLDHDIRSESIEMLWHSLITTVADKEHELLIHIQQLEQLDALAEKIEGEMKSFESRISELSSRMSNLNGQAIEKVHSSNIFTMMSSIETDIALIEKPLEQSLKDSHVLVERNHEKSKQLCEEATRLNQDYSQLKKVFFLQLAHKRTPRIGSTMNDQHFKNIDNLIKWCHDELAKVYQDKWGSELSVIQSDLDLHQKNHKIYDQFHTKVLQAERQSTSLTSNEASIYQQSLNELKKIYAELLSLSTKRLCDLQALYDFVTVVVDELEWFSSREQIEINRDWSNTLMDLNELNSHYKNTIREFNERKKEIEKVLNSTQMTSNFEAPSKIIANYSDEIQKHRSWFQQLINCFEVHFKNLAEYKHFYSDIEKQREWLISIKDQLDTKYSMSDFTIDQGEVLLRGMHAVYDELNQFNSIIEKLAKQSEKIVVLQERNQRAIINRQLSVKSLCTYSPNERILFEKNEIADLVNIDGIDWIVKTSKGEQVSAPNVLFSIQPPNEEVYQLIEKLRLTQRKMIELWEHRHLQIRRNLIRSTVRDVRGWTFDHFLSIGYEERQTIRRALNDDFNKIAAESNDHEIMQLKNEIIDVNHLLDEYEQRTHSEDENKHASQIFSERCLLLSNRLENLAKELDGIILSRFPQEKSEVEVILETINDFIKRLGFFDNDLKNLKETFMTIPMKTTGQKKNLDRLNELLKELDTQANLHRDRIVSLKDILVDYESNCIIAKDLENVLFSHFIMPSTLEGLRDLLKQLTSMQEVSIETQPALHRMNTTASQLGRMGVPTKSIDDLKILNTKLDKLNSRWNTLNLQLSDRIQSVETAIGLLKNLQTSLILEETWVETKAQKLKLLPASRHASDIDNILMEVTSRWKNEINNLIQTGIKLIQISKEFKDKFVLEINVRRKLRNRDHHQDKFDIRSVCETLLYELISKYNNVFRIIGDNEELHLHFVTNSKIKNVASSLKPENDLNSHHLHLSNIPKLSKYQIQIKDWQNFLDYKLSKMNSINENCSFLHAELESFARIQEDFKSNGFIENLSIDEYLEHLESYQTSENTKKSPLKVLKKLERRVVNLSNALKLKIINEETFELLNSVITKTNLKDFYNSDKYWIRNLETDEVLKLREAFDRDVLNIDDLSQIYLPFFKSLSISKLFERDLIENNYIIHPETGVSLNLHEAIDCDIVDKLSTIPIDETYSICLKEALKIGYVDGDQLTIHMKNATLSFEEAFKIGFLKDIDDDYGKDISYVGQTFLVIVKRKLFDTKKFEVNNKCLKLKFSIRDAIKNNYLMSTPSLPNCDEVLLLDALDQDLINFQNETYRNPRNREILSLSEAFEKGYLVLKKTNSSMLNYWTNFKFVDHIMRTRIVDILEGWKMISSNEVFNRKTGEKISMREAERRKIVVTRENTNQLRISKNHEIIDDSDESNTSQISEETEKLFSTSEVTDYVDESQETKVNTIIISTLKSITERFSSSPEVEIIKPSKIPIPTPRSKVSPSKSPEIIIEDKTEILPLRDAIMMRKITPEVCRIIENGEQLPLTVEDALTSKQINLTDLIEIVSSHSIVIVKNQTKSYELSLESNFSEENLVKMGFYDKINSCFMDPWSRRQITFNDFVNNLEVMNKEIYVKDTSSEKYFTLNEAFRMKIIDEIRGSFFNFKTNEHISIFNAVNRKFISSKLNEEINTLEIFDMKKLMKEGKIDFDNNEVIIGNENLTIEDAMKRGFFDSNLISVKDHRNERFLGLIYAEREGIVDIDRGIYKNTKTEKEISLLNAFKSCEIIPQKLRQISLNSLYSSGFFNAKENKIVDPETKHLLSLQRAIDKGIINPKLTRFNDEMTLTEAIEKNLINSNSMKIHEFLKNGNLTNNSIVFDLIDMIKMNYYDKNTGLFLNPFTNQFVTLANGIKINLIDVTRVRIKDKNNNKMITYFEAKFNGIIDEENGRFKTPNMSLDEALLKNILDNDQKPISLPIALELEMFDKTSKKFVIDGVEMSLHDAIMTNKIDGNDRVIHDRNADLFLSVNESIKTGLTDPIDCTIIDTLNNREIYFDEAFDEFMILNPQFKIDLEEAINTDRFDIKSMIFKNISSLTKFSLKSAIQRGFIDIEHCFVHVENRHLKFKEAVDCDIVDLQNCVLKSQQNYTIDLCEAFDTGIMRTLYKPMTLCEAQFKGFYDKSKDLCIDPNTGDKTSLNHGITNGIINPISLNENFMSGISIQFAIQKGFFDDKRGRISIPTNSWKMNLNDATKTFLINPYLPVYFDEIKRRILSLNEAMRMKIIHRTKAYFLDPITSRRMSLKVALENGWLIDIETANFSLYNLLYMKLYDQKSRKLIHPKTYQKLSISESKSCGLIDPTLSLVKNQNGKFTTINESISNGILNENDNFYQISDSEIIGLDEAFNRGFIISNKKPYDLKQAIEMSLYRAETGKFLDPISSLKYDLESAMKENLINSRTTKYFDHITQQSKALREAIEDGEIDVLKGRVYDSRTDSSYNYDVGFELGILIHISKALISNNEDNQPKLMSLEKMIMENVVNIQTSYVKYIQTSEFIRLGIFLQKNTEFLSRNLFVSKKSFHFTVGNEYLIYKNKPKTFDELLESKQLDLASGLISDDSTLDREVTIEQAVNIGYLDSESFVIKNFSTKKLEHIEEAIKSGIFDISKNQIIDSTVSKIYNLESAIEQKILKTKQQRFDLHELYEFGLFENELIQHPFIRIPNLMTFGELLDKNLLNLNETLLRNPKQGEIISLENAIYSNIIDKNSGKFNDENSIDLRKAIEDKIFIKNDERQAVIEKFALCEENISILSRWINDIEQRISKIGGISENIEEMQMQVNILKQIKNDIDLQSHPIASCLEQVRQLVLTSGNALSVSEVAALENSGRNLRLRFDRSMDTTLTLTKHLNNGIDDLEKLHVEYRNFARWLNTVYANYEHERSLLSDLQQTTAQSSRIDEMLKEIVARQADIRFITMSTQKFVDETKQYLDVLNDLRSALPERLPNVQMIGSFKSPTRQTVSELQQKYNDILDQTNALAERQSIIREAYEKYNEHLQKTKKWLSDNQILVSNLVATPVATEVETIQEQLHLAKSLLNTFLSNRKLIDDLQSLLENLLISLTGLISPTVAGSLEVPVDQAKKDYKNLLEAIDNRCQILEVSFAQAQETQAALDNLIEKMKKADEKLRLSQQPASLIIEKLAEQISEYQFVMSEVETIKAALQGVTNSAREFIKHSSNARSTKVIESKLQSASEQYAQLKNKSSAYNEFLNSIYNKLKKFNVNFETLEKELEKLQEMVNLDEKSVEVLMKVLQEISQNRKNLQPAIDDCLRNGKELVNTKNVTDVYAVRDKLKRLETMWETLGIRITEKLKLTKQKAEKLVAFENSKKEIQLWLTSMESKIAAFEPVALDLKILDMQLSDVKRLLADYENFNKNIKKINNIAMEYNSIVRASSPTSTSVDRQDFTDFSFIQQEISDINNRYSFIGLKLNDRKTALAEMRVAVQKQRDNLDQLITFLRKLEKDFPRMNLTLREDAENSTKLIRRMINEMAEKQDKLEATKLEVRGLIHGRENVAGAENLKLELETILEQWQKLQKMLADCLSCADICLDFLKNHEILSNWLTQKSKLLTTLGPISPDPRVVKSQLHQISVLKDDFDGQKIHYDNLIDSGRSLSRKFKDNTTEHRIITSKTDEIEKKWNDLYNQLSQRYKVLSNIVDISEDFDGNCNRLRDTMQKLSDSLDNLQRSNNIDEKCQKLMNIERQVDGLPPHLSDIESSAAVLIKSIDDQQIRASIANKVEGLNKQFNALKTKLAGIKNENESFLRNKQNFIDDCSKMISWIEKNLSSFDGPLLISGRKATLIQQLNSNQAILGDIKSKEHEINLLINRSRETRFQSEAPYVEKMKTQWIRLKEEGQKRQIRLQKVSDIFANFESCSSKFLQWLEKAEHELNSIQPGMLVKKDLDRESRVFENLRNEVSRNTNEYKKVLNVCDELFDGCDVDKDYLMEDKQNIQTRWDELSRAINSKLNIVAELTDYIIDYNEQYRALNAFVQRNEDAFDSIEKLNENNLRKDPRSMEKIRMMIEDNVQLKNNFQNLKILVEKIVMKARPAGYNCDNLYADLERLSDRILTLEARLDDRFKNLKSATEALADFKKNVDIVSLDLSELERRVEELVSTPIARVVKMVKTQIGNTENLMQTVEDFNNKITEVRRVGDLMIENGYVAKPSEIYGPIDDMKHKRLRLESRLKDYLESLLSILKQLTKFYDDYESALDEISKVDFEMKKNQSVSSETQQIRMQKQDFVNFKKQFIEPVDRKMGDLNEIGRDLIRSASKSVSTEDLENDLERILIIWNQLKTNIAEYDRKLDQALAQSGKFHDALDALMRWLKETEEQVRNQKPPSVDYKVVKAQIHEQKFLLKVIDDNETPINSLCRLSEEIVQTCDPSEKMSIELPIEDLKNRYIQLKTKAHNHMRLLENAVDISKAFEDKVNSLTVFLEKAEKTFKSLENVPCNEDKIDRNIKELDRLNNEVNARDHEVNQLVGLKNDIRKIFDHEEFEIANEKIDNINDRYKMLCDDLSRLRGRIDKIKHDLSSFIQECNIFAEWCEKQDRQLQNFKNVPIHVDSIQQQYEKLQSMRHDIEGKSRDLANIAKIAKELSYNIESNEAFKLKDKIDSIEKPYNELCKKSEAYLKMTNEGLQTASKFHEAHNNLTKWMQDAEEILVTSNSNNFDNILSLENDLPRMRGELELINSHGRQLAKLASEENSAAIEAIITRSNRRFEAIVEQIQRKAERFQITLQRSREVNADLDELLKWFRNTEDELKDAATPSIDPTEVKEQLKNHRTLNDNIITNKGRSREVTMSAKKLMNELEPYSENLIAIQDKLEDLQNVIGNVTRLSSERLTILEQVAPLCEHFGSSKKDLEHWLSEIEHEISLFTPPGVRIDQIKNQQEKNDALMQTVANHKPFIEKFNKIGDDLAAFMTRQDANYIHDVVSNINDRYNALKTELRERQFALEKALEEASLLADKLENMLRSLENTAEKMKNVDPISAHPPKISNQIDDNWHVIEDLDKREPSLVAVRQAADEIIAKATNYADPAVKELQKKLEKLNVLWVDIQKEVKIRDSSLNDTLAAAEKFWNELEKVMKKLRKIKDALTNQEPVATEPRAIQHQQNELKAVGQEIQNTRPDVEHVNTTGTDLISLVGDSDKPEIRRRIEDLNNEWGNITLLYSQREDNLIQAMEKAMQFHDILQKILDFLDQSEKRMRNLRPIAADIAEIKNQIGEIKKFKDDVDEHNPDVEMLNRQLNELSEITSVDQAAGIRNGVSNINTRWDSLKKAISDRHKALENALLDLGQFEHALKEIVVWIKKTQDSVDQIKVVPGDAKILELESAKLKILINDTQAHQSSVANIMEAGKKLAFDSPDPSVTNEKLENLNKIWNLLQRSISSKEKELDDELIEAQNFAIELQDTMSWLQEIENSISSTKASGALPDTAKEQLEKFMDIYDEIERNKSKVERILAQGENYLKKHSEMNMSQSSLQHSLKSLKQRWDGLIHRANDKKIKLEIALKEANEFNQLVESFSAWLMKIEDQIGKLSQVSRVLPTVQQQIDDHKYLQKEIESRQDDLQQLEKKGSDLRYFCQKQDGIIIKNHLTSLKHRWDSIMSKQNERKNSLDQAFKESKAFYDNWTTLTNWLKENQVEIEKIEADLGNSSDPSKVKQALEKIQKIQRTLSLKQTEYDAVLQSGKNLLSKASKPDEPELKRMLNDLKDLWTKNCTKTVNAQRKLEEILMVAGQFNEALVAILEWLRKSKARFTDETRVHGDIDTVSNLIDQHKRFENDMQNRVKQIESILENGNKLNASQPAPNVVNNLREVEQLWDFIKRSNAERKEDLKDALKDAEKLHKKFNVLMEWLSNAEQKLKYAPSVPNDEDESQRILDEFNEFLNELQQKEHDKDVTKDLAENILSKAHPDAVKILKTIIQTLQERWDEISQWAWNREKFLNEHLQTLKNLDGKISDLMAWLIEIERMLRELEEQELPEDIPLTEKLIEEHKEFMENTAMKQNEIDVICKPSRPKPTLKDARKSQSRMSVMRTASRLSPSAISEAKSNVANTADDLPHYGPKFSSSTNTDADFKSPRAKQLWEKWRNIWMMAWNRQKRLHDHLLMLKEKEKVKHFDWEDWRKRFLKFHNYKRSKVVDFLTKMDKKQIGLIPKEIFIEEFIKQKIPTKRHEVESVAEMFEIPNKNSIDWQEFLIALKPDWAEAPCAVADAVHEEVRRLVMMCTCRQKFRVFQVGEGKYRFGAEQKLRLVRVLRSTVMVRVGGGWTPLSEFLMKNDPCRAVGKTNAQLREEFILAAGISQKMQAFTPRHSISGANQSPPDDSGEHQESMAASTSLGYHSSHSPSSVSKIPMKKSTSTRSSITPNTSRPVSRQGSSFSLTSDDGKFSFKSRSTTPRSSRIGRASSRTSSPSKKSDENRPPFK